MQNPRLAARYAKSLLDIAMEQNNLDAILADMQYLNRVCQSNPDFVSMLKSPVVKGDKKMEILTSIFGAELQKVTFAFIDLMVKKGREVYMPEIAATFLEQYKTYKHIHTVNLTTATPVDESLKQYIFDKVAPMIEGTVDLQTEVNESIIGGFVLKVGDRFFDASIRRDLTDIRNQFTKNLYVADI